MKHHRVGGMNIQKNKLSEVHQTLMGYVWQIVWQLFQKFGICWDNLLMVYLGWILYPSLTVNIQIMYS